ncbi:MAG: tetratricopeptide repeat protein [Planctomycetota bacterium]
MLAEAEEQFGPFDLTVAEVCDALGRLYLRRDDPAEAAVYISRTDEAFRRVLPARHARLAETLVNLGRALMDAQRPERARDAFAEAVEIDAPGGLTRLARDDLEPAKAPIGAR